MKFNYNQPITKQHIDMSAYERKFKYVDDIKECLRQDKNYEPAPYELKNIRDDPTKFAYYFLRDNNGKPFKLYPYQDMILNNKHDRIYFRASNQLGKEQPVSSLVLTEKGYKKMGDIEVRDIVYGSDGKPCNVLEIFHQGLKPVYKLIFSDGSVAECGLEHLWKVQLPKNRFKANFTGRWKRRRDSRYGRWDIVTLKYLIDEFGLNPIPPQRCIIPVTESVEFKEQELPIHPYIVGVMLGDGTMSKNFGREITSADEEIINAVGNFLPVGLTIKQKPGKYHYNICTAKWRRGQIWSILFKKAGLKMAKSEDKVVPNKYLYSSPEQRLWLLKGLMDTDGTIGGKMTIEFYSKSIHLAEGVRFLVNSLGGKVRIVEKKAWYRDKTGKRIDCGICHRVRIYMNETNPFHLSRKANLHYTTRYRKERVLREIKFDRYEECKCIVVDSPDHTYLTNECIVTHNSKSFNIKAVWNLLRDHKHAHNEAIVSKSLPQSTFQMRRVKALLNTMKVDWKDFNTDRKTTTDSLSLITYDIKDKKTRKVKYTNMLICTPCTEGLLGYDLHELNLDEFEYWTDIDLKWFYNQIAQPRLYTTKGNIFIMTNPNGSDNFGAELENQTLKEGSRRFHTYVFSYLDKPGNTQKEYDQLKHELSRQEFESTVAAIRSISSLSYFSPDEIERSYDPKLSELNMVGKQPFFFLDVGAKHDQSCLVGGYTEPYETYDTGGKKSVDENKPQFNNVFIPIIHLYPVGYPISRVAGVAVDDADGWHYEKSVKEYLEEYSKGGMLPVFGFDVTGNEGMNALFEAIRIDAQDVVFSGPNKSGMYQRFKYLMEKGLLHRIKNKDFEQQAQQLIATKGARGYLLINAASHVKKGGKTEDAKLKRIPDDTMDATAGLVQLCDPMGIVEPSLEVF